MATNPLSAAPVAALITKSLPTDSEPQLQTPEQAVAIACHAGFLSVGFKFVGLTEKTRLRAYLCLAQPATPTSDRLPATPSTADAPTPLPAAWNASSTLEFAYTHPQSSMTFVLKIFSLGSKTVINAIGIEHNKAFNFDLTTKDFISDSALPASPSKAASPEDAHHTVMAIYITPSRLTDLCNSLKLNIIQKLLPSLQKEGYEEESSSSATTSQRPNDNGPPSNPRDPAYQPPPHIPQPGLDPARPHPLADPSIAPRRPPIPAGEMPPPGFEDPYDINRGPRGGMPPLGGGGVGPGYGERDLYPPGMGPNDPLRIGGGGGPRGGGGMAMDFDDIDARAGGPGGLRAPPGARYDPPGPYGHPYDPLMDGQRRGPGPGGPGGGFGPRFGGAGGAPPNPFGGFGSGDFI